MERRQLEGFCDAWFAAWTGTDVARLASFYAEDCRYVDPARPEGIMGRGALARYLDRLLRSNPAMLWTRERLDPVEGGFVVTWRALVPMAGGEPVALKGMDLVLLRGREIVLNEVHFDMSVWLARIGRSPRG